jgi:hypothetical protein
MRSLVFKHAGRSFYPSEIYNLLTCVDVESAVAASAELPSVPSVDKRLTLAFGTLPFFIQSHGVVSLHQRKVWAGYPSNSASPTPSTDALATTSLAMLSGTGRPFDSVQHGPCLVCCKCSAAPARISTSTSLAFSSRPTRLARRRRVARRLPGVGMLTTRPSVPSARAGGCRAQAPSASARCWRSRPCRPARCRGRARCRSSRRGG